MKERIIRELDEIERSEGIRILFAVESGSRAWGFESTDSDWDVRFVYIHRPEWYLSILDGRDVLEYPIADALDVSGWELRKALRLFRKSNPPLLEWLRSPIVYRETSLLAPRLRELSGAYFSPKACLYHYLHMAEGNYREYLQRDLVLAKKYFYVLRPLLACQWIERTGTPPPMEFQALLDAEVRAPSLRAVVEPLLERKRAGEDLGREPRIPVLNDFLEERIRHFNEIAPDARSLEYPDPDTLNRLFREILEAPS